LLAAGCGSAGEIKGKVTFKGEPLKFGNVTAVASNGSFASVIDSEGNYTLKGVGTGKVKFYVSCNNPEAEACLKDKVASLKADGGGDKIVGRGVGPTGKTPTKAEMQGMPKLSLIPEKYMDMTKDLLVRDVVSGSNNIDLPLEP